MPQRWTKLLMVLGVVVFFAACQKSNYSSDQPLSPSYSSSVFISSDNDIVYAFDPQSGNEHWHSSVSNNVQATPIVIGNNLFVPTLYGNIYIFDKKINLIER